MARGLKDVFACCKVARRDAKNSKSFSSTTLASGGGSHRTASPHRHHHHHHQAPCQYFDTCFLGGCTFYSCKVCKFVGSKQDTLADHVRAEHSFLFSPADDSNARGSGSSSPSPPSMHDGGDGDDALDASNSSLRAAAKNGYRKVHKGTSEWKYFVEKHGVSGMHLNSRALFFCTGHGCDYRSDRETHMLSHYIRIHILPGKPMPRRRKYGPLSKMQEMMLDAKRDDQGIWRCPACPYYTDHIKNIKAHIQRTHASNREPRKFRKTQQCNLKPVTVRPAPLPEADPVPPPPPAAVPRHVSPLPSIFDAEWAQDGTADHPGTIPDVPSFPPAALANSNEDKPRRAPLIRLEPGITRIRGGRIVSFTPHSSSSSSHPPEPAPKDSESFEDFFECGGAACCWPDQTQHARGQEDACVSSNDEGGRESADAFDVGSMWLVPSSECLEV